MAPGPQRGHDACMHDDDVHTPARIQPGPLLAAAVLVAALLALALLHHAPGAGSPATPSGTGPAVQLLPAGQGDATAAQYGRGLHRDTGH